MDRVLKMADYGHASIRDLAPVPVFMDGLSIGLIMLIWNLCPIAAGQESSTRYLKFDESDLQNPYLLGIPDSQQAVWMDYMSTAFQRYHEAVALWEEYGRTSGEAVSRIPDSVKDDPKKYARMLRNYAFDRARVFLPVAAKSNVALLMSGNEWLRLVQILLSGPTPEMKRLGTMLRDELTLSIPRMLKHAEPKTYWTDWWDNESCKRRNRSLKIDARDKETSEAAPVRTFLETPLHPDEDSLLSAMETHRNRYAPFGTDITTQPVAWEWDGIAIAELRDVNRHRSGTRYLDLVPRGFHDARDECADEDMKKRLADMGSIGRSLGRKCQTVIQNRREHYLSWMLLGTQVGFQHRTTLDKMIYETELRTGVGAHYRYAQHERDLLALLYQKFPKLKGVILEGSSEPE